MPLRWAVSFLLVQPQPARYAGDGHTDNGFRGLIGVTTEVTVVAIVVVVVGVVVVVVCIVVVVVVVALYCFFLIIFEATQSRNQNLYIRKRA